MIVTYGMRAIDGFQVISDETAKWIKEEGTEKIRDLAKQINTELKKEDPEYVFGALFTVASTTYQGKKQASISLDFDYPKGGLSEIDKAIFKVTRSVRRP